LVVEGAVKIWTGLLTGNVGEIRMQSGCFYWYDGSAWHVINKKAWEWCPKVACTYASVLLSPGDNVQAYTQPYSMDCSQNFQTVYCNEDWTLGNGWQYYPYCYNLTGWIWYAEEMAQCGTADGWTYVNSPTMTDWLCANGTPWDIDTQNTLFAWQCSVWTSVANCSATKVYPCNGEQPTWPGVISWDTTQAYSTNLSSWTPVAQGVSPWVCQWTCAEWYEQQANGCSWDVINEPGWCGTYNPSDFEDLDMYFLTNDWATWHYTLMDRNLWATQVYSGVNNVCTYGYFYQWWNNYGFATIWTINIAYNKQVNASWYWPGNYYSSGTFLPQQPWSSVRNDNLWWWVSGTNYAMRWPCPSGYHVPAKHEFVNMINTYWRNSVDNQTPSQFAMDFLMSRAGERNYMHPNEVSGQGSYGHYWYSTHYASMVGGSLAFSYTDLYPDYNGPASNGKSIRCMKNSPNSNLTIHPDGWTWALIIVHGNEITKLWTPHKWNMIFGWWYSDSSFTPASQVRTWDMVSAWTHLYAKWGCAEGYYMSGDTCLPNEIINQCEINSSNFEDLDMYFLTNDWSTWYTSLMDRNLWATAYMEQSWKTASDWYGCFFQWWNNYGFPNQWPVSTSTTRVNASEYGPGTPLGYYSSDTFIKVSMSPFRWDSSNNSNLWWNNGSESNRQWPCPDGYHVPTDNEFLGMINNWKKSENYTNTNFSSQWSLDFLMPLAGYRDRDTSSVNYQGTQGYYWSSTAYNLLNNGNAYNLNFSSSSLQTQSGYGRALGFSVRCFRNSPTPSLTLYPDGWKKAVITVHNGKIRKLWTPTKSWKTFWWWYSDAGFTSQVHEWDSVPSSAELYVKWQ